MALLILNVNHTPILSLTNKRGSDKIEDFLYFTFHKLLSREIWFSACSNSAETVFLVSSLLGRLDESLDP